MSRNKMLKSRQRAPNFTREERALLYTLMEPFMHIIENKKSDNVKQHQKHEAWYEITELYNANTMSVPRSAENLLACYRNMKSKSKKDHSLSETSLEDSNVNDLLAMEENDKEWEAIATQTQKPILDCQDFENLKKDIKEHERKHKMAILRTEATETHKPLSCTEDNEQEKSNIPRRSSSACKDDNEIIDIDQPPNKKMVNTQDISMKRSSGLTGVTSSSNVKFNAVQKKLTEEKLELIRIQKEIALMEMDHKKAIFKLEMEEIKKENDFKEQMRQKEKLLMELKIKKHSQ